MAFEDIQVEINYLLQQMTEQPEDVHELATAIREKISELRAMGMPVPEDLIALEKQLEEEYGA